MKKLKKRIKKLLKKINLKKIAATSMSIILVAVATASAANHKSDQYLFNRVVKLEGPSGGSCSGQQIIAPSGKMYVLTAAHCKDLVKGGSLETESGKKFPSILVAEDDKADLLLLEGIPGLLGLHIAKSDYDREHVRTFTHGMGMKAYKTEGVLIEDQEIKILIGPILSALDMEQCQSKPKYSVDFMFGIMPVCILSVKEKVTTAFAAPGSSGGMDVDDNGDVVGIVTGGDGSYSYFVMLEDIHRFLQDK